ncbi:mitochondrial carrier superfamily protein [Toxoplasma gondii ARI]|uniref:Mitochondrial carrier superfamily protein n=1 Tax=Toxoplasma gondii ARI TaxID=1074872 RepID=A0A139Y980_TOXGO|nr:mitochondrial carrier superfamily protein [Toxoplasma gondii ARI]
MQDGRAESRLLAFSAGGRRSHARRDSRNFAVLSAVCLEKRVPSSSSPSLCASPSRYEQLVTAFKARHTDKRDNKKKKISEGVLLSLAAVTHGGTAGISRLLLAPFDQVKILRQITPLPPSSSVSSSSSSPSSSSPSSSSPSSSPPSACSSPSSPMSSSPVPSRSFASSSQSAPPAPSSVGGVAIPASVQSERKCSSSPSSRCVSSSFSSSSSPPSAPSSSSSAGSAALKSSPGVNLGSSLSASSSPSSSSFCVASSSPRTSSSLSTASRSTGSGTSGVTTGPSSAGVTVSRFLFVSSFWWGSSAAVYASIAASSIRLALYQRARLVFFSAGDDNYTGAQSWLRHVGCMSVCAFAALAVCYPLDVAHTAMCVLAASSRRSSQVASSLQQWPSLNAFASGQASAGREKGGSCGVFRPFSSETPANGQHAAMPRQAAQERRTFLCGNATERKNARSRRRIRPLRLTWQLYRLGGFRLLYSGFGLCAATVLPFTLISGLLHTKFYALLLSVHCNAGETAQAKVDAPSDGEGSGPRQGDREVTTEKEESRERAERGEDAGRREREEEWGRAGREETRETVTGEMKGRREAFGKPCEAEGEKEETPKAPRWREAATAAFAAGLCAQLATYPLDTIRRRQQYAAICRALSPPSTSSASPSCGASVHPPKRASRVCRLLGFPHLSRFFPKPSAGLWRGVGVVLARAGPECAISVSVYSFLMGNLPSLAYH